MIAGYAVAGQMLEEKKYIDTAARCAEFLLKTLRTKEGRLLRSYGAAPGEKVTVTGSPARGKIDAMGKDTMGKDAMGKSAPVFTVTALKMVAASCP